ncbi:MAG: polysaccharide deacetylase family protein, partial [Pseudonocardiaceae bacterium]
MSSGSRRWTCGVRAYGTPSRGAGAAAPEACPRAPSRGRSVWACCFLRSWLITLLLVTLVGLVPILGSQPAQTTEELVTYTSRLISSTARKGHFVALTFDDGPNPTWTPQVLDLLKQHDVHATFCLIGQNVDRYPDLVRRTVAEGHRLCDHTVDHDDLRDSSNQRVRSEIRGGLDAIRRAVPDAAVRYYRAPYGAWSAYQVKVAARAGMRSLSWSVDTRDWAQPGVSAILATVDRDLRPGGVILMHDSRGDRSQSVAALRILLRDLPRQGYRFD